MDIETANRVIENALGGLSSCSSSSSLFGSRSAACESAFNSELISGHINSVINDARAEEEKEAAEIRRGIESPVKDRYRASAGHSSASGESGSSRAMASTSLNSNSNGNGGSSAKRTLSPLSSNSSPPPPQPPPTHRASSPPVSDDEKPLNLSSSTVLHTSNQHIIDHFIEKMLNTGLEGE